MNGDEKKSFNIPDNDVIEHLSSLYKAQILTVKITGIEVNGDLSYNNNAFVTFKLKNLTYQAWLAQPSDTINGLGLFKMLVAAMMQDWDVAINLDKNGYIINVFVFKS